MWFFFAACFGTFVAHFAMCKNMRFLATFGVPLTISVTRIFLHAPEMCAKVCVFLHALLECADVIAALNAAGNIITKQNRFLCNVGKLLINSTNII